MVFWVKGSEFMKKVALATASALFISVALASSALADLIHIEITGFDYSNNNPISLTMDFDASLGVKTTDSYYFSSAEYYSASVTFSENGITSSFLGAGHFQGGMRWAGGIFGAASGVGLNFPFPLSDFSAPFDLVGISDGGGSIVNVIGFPAYAISFSVSTASLEIIENDGTPIFPAIPEPSSWAMLVIGFAGIGFATYRRKMSVAMVR
jgi:hypothetical protein